MDLKSLTPSSDTIEIIVKDPRDLSVAFTNDDGSEMTIEVYAPHTKQYKNSLYKQASTRMKLGQEEIDFELLDKASCELLADVTKAWDITFDGEKPKLTKKKALDIYKEVFWLKMQVEEAINTFEVFTKD